MSATVLKLLAVVLMLGDHVAEYLGWGMPEWLFLCLRYLGRIAAPVFFYLSVESWFKTRNQKKYLTRLMAAAAMMMVGNWLVYEVLTAWAGVKAEPVGHNIFLTIFLGVSLVGWWEWRKSASRNQRLASSWKKVGIKVLSWVMVGTVAVTMLFSEFSFWAVGMYGVFYWFRSDKKQMMLAFLMLCLADLLRAYWFGWGELGRVEYQWMMMLAIPVLWVYNGKRGAGLKEWFYGFYPVHLWILYGLSYWLGMGR